MGVLIFDLRLLNKNSEVQECDATKTHSSNSVRLQKNSLKKISIFSQIFCYEKAPYLFVARRCYVHNI